MKGPNFFIVGAQKCGTTSMYHYLKQHPEIFMSEVKEPQFFGTDLLAPYFIRDQGAYHALFSGARDEKALGEASPLYIYSKRAATEIKQCCPAAKIIIMLRNPVDMIYSLHAQNIYSGREDIKDFETALAAEDERKRGLRRPTQASPVECLFYREQAKYTEQVQRYLDVFGRENVRIIFFDDLTSETARVYSETCEFLGVNPDFAPDFRIVNSHKSVRSMSVLRFILYPPTFASRLVRAVVPPSLRLDLAWRLRRLNTKHDPRPPMEARLRRDLQAEFLPEVERLSELLGRDLTGWCRS